MQSNTMQYNSNLMTPSLQVYSTLSFGLGCATAPYK